MQLESKCWMPHFCLGILRMTSCLLVYAVVVYFEGEIHRCASSTGASLLAKLAAAAKPFSNLV